MTTEMLIALCGFAFVSSITPGPNNMMLMASGVNFGLRRTVPHLLGVALGFVAMVILVGLGAARVMAQVSWVEPTLRAGCLAFILWMAWKLARAALDAETPRPAAPMTFVQAAAFQWINPKAWAMALTAIAAYAPDRTVMAVTVVGVVFGIINLPSVFVWAAMGLRMRGWLGAVQRRQRIFNAVMAVLLVASVVPML